MANNEKDWYEDESEQDEPGLLVKEYDITASPNDFNIKTIFDFISSGVVRIPGFQRNFVWDIKRASKLIESILIGLPIPQIFLFEKSRNQFLVIDGQQRLMSIYYFIEGRFPRVEKRIELRKIFDKDGRIPEPVLHDDSFFDPFNLELPPNLPAEENKLDGLNYHTVHSAHLERISSNLAVFTDETCCPLEPSQPGSRRPASEREFS